MIFKRFWQVFFFATLLITITLVVYIGSRLSDERDIRNLKAVIRQMELQIDELASHLERPKSSAPRFEIRVPSTKESGKVDSFELAIADFSRRLLVLEEQMLNRPLERRSRIVPGQLTPETIQSALTDAVNTSIHAERRIQALRILRLADKRTPEVVNSMINLILDRRVDSGVRENAIRHLGGATNSNLKTPLLNILTTERDPGIRSEAIETLQPFYSDPEVFSVVSGLQSDPDERVKKEAERRLGEWQSRKKN